MCRTEFRLRRIGAPLLLAFGFAQSLIAQPTPEPPKEVKPLFDLSGHTQEAFTVAFSPDGKKLASASNREVKIWDPSTGKEICSYAIVGTHVYGLAFNADGSRLALGISKVIKILDTTSGKEVSSIGGAAHFLFRMTFSPDGKYLASSGGSSNASGDVRVWEATTGKLVLTLTGHNEAVLTVAYSADGRLLASGGGATSGAKAGEVKIWDAVTGHELATMTGHPENVYGVAFSPDGRRLISVGGGARNTLKPGTMKAWEVATGSEIAEYGGHSAPVFSVVFSPDGKCFATAGGDKTIKLRDTYSGLELKNWSAHTNTVFSLSFNPTGRRLASGSHDKAVKIWDSAIESPPFEASDPPRTNADFDKLWADLERHDAAIGHCSIRQLLSAPALTVAYTRKRIVPARPLSEAEGKQAAEWIQQLDSARFAVREKASKSLAEMGEPALPMLRAALASTRGLEVRERLQRLVDRLSYKLLPGQLTEIRAIETLERISTSDAHSLLRDLAAGYSESRLTHEAHAAVERLKRAENSRTIKAE